jgi:hypothetical protein
MEDCHHSIEQWKTVIIDQQANGLSGRAYCQLHAIRECRFYYWLRKICEASVANQPVVISTNQGPVTEPQFAVVFAATVTVRKHQKNIPKLVLHYGPVQLELADQTSPELLRQTLQVLQNVLPPC